MFIHAEVLSFHGINISQLSYQFYYIYQYYSELRVNFIQIENKSDFEISGSNTYLFSMYTA